MALITRISRLFSADLHAVLDRVEEPGIVLKQAIRDMEAAVTAAERQIKALRLQEEHVAASTTGAEGRLREAGEELEVCLDAGNDELARNVLHRKLQLERHLAALEIRGGRLSRSVDEQERILNQRRRELDTLRSKAEAFEDTGPSGLETSPETAVTREEVEVALLREKQRRARS